MRSITKEVDIHPEMDETLFPFGFYHEPFDNLYAIERARELLANITEPPVALTYAKNYSG